MCGLLPAGSLVANLPQGIRQRSALALNATIAAAAADQGLVLVDLWARTGPPWRGKFSADHFHPNDLGYGDWATAFADALPFLANGGRH